jgi:tetratricopeptide (TPR) repeat protein
LGKWKEAIAAHQEAIRLKPDYAGAHFNLGFAYVSTGKKKEAEAELKILQPLNASEWNQLYVMIYKKAPPKS